MSNKSKLFLKGRARKRIHLEEDTPQIGKINNWSQLTSIEILISWKTKYITLMSTSCNDLTRPVLVNRNVPFLRA